ncbi:hypothetical protein D3C76_1144400 [compost metagenome]
MYAALEVVINFFISPFGPLGEVETVVALNDEHHLGVRLHVAEGLQLLVDVATSLTRLGFHVADDEHFVVNRRTVRFVVAPFHHLQRDFVEAHRNITIGALRGVDLLLQRRGDRQAAGDNLQTAGVDVHVTEVLAVMLLNDRAEAGFNVSVEQPTHQVFAVGVGCVER